jgi:hypothetical protein
MIVHEVAIQPASDTPKNRGVEEKLLFLCSRNCISLSSADQIQALCQQSPDWEHLIHLATSHGVIPLLFQSLRDTCPELVPEAVMAQLQHHRRANMLKNLELTSELLRLMGLFEANGIRVVTFKGPVLASMAYGSTALRQMGDLDLLVAETDFSAAQDVITREGYQLHMELPWECQYLSEDDRFSVDLHPQVTPKHFSYNLNSAYWWAQIESVPLSGMQVPTFKVEAQLVMLCLNGAKECWRKLNRICDVAELVRSHPNLDWEEVLSQARTYGLQRLIYLGLRLAHERLEAPLPSLVERQVYSEPVVQGLAEEVYQAMFEQEPWLIGEIERTAFLIRVHDRWDHKFRSLAGIMQFYGWLGLELIKKGELKIPEGSVAFEFKQIYKLSLRFFKKRYRMG